MQSLNRHIESHHKNEIKRIQRWCSYCQNNTTGRVSTHVCLQGNRFYITDGTAPELIHKCHRCPAAFPSKQGLTNPKRIHDEADRRAHRDNARRNTNIVPTRQQYSSNGTQNTNNSMPPPSSTASVNYSIHDTQGHDPNEDQNHPAGLVDDDNSPDNEDEGDYHLQNNLIPNPDDDNPSKEYHTIFSNILRSYNSEKWEDFEETLHQSVIFSQGYVKLKDNPPGNRANKKFNNKDPAAMQRLYRRNCRRAALNIPSTQCHVPANDLKEKFFNTNNNIYDPSIFTTRDDSLDPPDTSLFTPIEIKSKLAKCENTAPSLDRLTYHHWKGVDPDCKTITSGVERLQHNLHPEKWWSERPGKLEAHCSIQYSLQVVHKSRGETPLQLDRNK